MDEKNLMTQAIQAGLYGTNPDEIARNKLAIKAALRRAITLVDADLLGCIIITERLDQQGTRVEMTPYGNPALILQTAKQLVRQATPKDTG